MIEILDIGDFRVSDYSLLKAKEENPTIFVSDHEKTVLRLLSSNLKIKSISMIMTWCVRLVSPLKINCVTLQITKY